VLRSWPFGVFKDAIQGHVNDLLRGYGFADFRVGHLDRYDATAQFYLLPTLFDLQCRIDVQCRATAVLRQVSRLSLQSSPFDLGTPMALFGLEV
jgi:hypothetical protein